MEDFVALDLETANSDYASICEIGLVRFTNGIPIDSLSSFVSLPDGLDYFENTWIHGITEKDCRGAPDFSEAIQEAQRFIGGSPVIAHYTGFDIAAIRKAANLAGLPYPTMAYFCTVVMSRKALRGKIVSFRLQAVADYFGLEFEQEHRAQGDAEAAGKIAAKLMALGDVASLADLAEPWKSTLGNSGRRWTTDASPFRYLPPIETLVRKKRPDSLSSSAQHWVLRNWIGREIFMDRKLSLLERYSR